MTTLIILIALVLYIGFYFLYGRYLERRVVQAQDGNDVPAHRRFDGVDFVPANKFVLFGHHFASIAGAAPIVGPAMAMAFGWLPGLLWIWFGNIFIGAVHDYFSLTASVRYDGKSIQYIARQLLGRFTGTSFAWFTLFLCILVVAAFGGIAGSLFVKQPQAASSFVFMIVAALILGVLLYRSKLAFWAATLVGILLLVGAIWLGAQLPIKLDYTTWMIVFFVYIIIAASLPVTVLLQPRDYLNSFLLYFGLAVGIAAAVLGAREFAAPVLTEFAPKLIGNARTGFLATPFWPAIPLIIACGSLSGFHSLVASGTSSKQLSTERDGLFIGYGSMFTEGVLATLAVIAVAAFGLTALQKVQPALAGPLAADWGAHYTETAAKVGGAANMFVLSFATMTSTVLPLGFQFMKIITAMWVAAFAMTTLDTTNRLSRYIVSELAEPLSERFRGLYRLLSNRWVASLLPAAVGIGLAWSGGWLLLWPAFSSANQLLASITMITVSAWIARKLDARHLGVALFPGLLLWVTVSAAMIWYLGSVVPTMISAMPARGYIVGTIMVVMLILNLILLVSFIRNQRRSSAGGG